MHTPLKVRRVIFAVLAYFLLSQFNVQISPNNGHI